MKRIVYVLLFVLTIFVSSAKNTNADTSYMKLELRVSQTRRNGKTCYYPDCIEPPNFILFDVRVYAKELGKDGLGRVFYNIGDPIIGTIELNADGVKEKKDLVNGITTFDVAGNTSTTGTIPFTIKIDEKEILTNNRTLELLLRSQIGLSRCTQEDINLCGEEHLFDAQPFRLCNQVEASKIQTCQKCITKGVWTAVGCIPTDPSAMIKVLLRIGLLIGGGVALLIILAGSFSLSISQGDPKKTSEAKEMISSALIGLVFIIFSISILQLIGVQIMQIPGFGQP